MATIKSYTDLSQGETLSKILPLESADMEYLAIKENGKLIGNIPFVKDDSEVEDSAYSQIYDRFACWSLYALINIASTYCSRLEITLRTDKKYNVFAVKNDFIFRSFDECSEGYNNPVDACYKLILKLHELNLL